MAQDLHQQFGRIPARARALLESLLGRLHAGLQPDHIPHLGGEPPVQLDQKVNRDLRFPRDAGEISRQARGRRLRCTERRQPALLDRLIAEGEFLCIALEEEIEGIEDCHLGHQIDLDAQFAHPLGEDDAGQIVRLRILLPVDEVLGGHDLEGIGQDPSAAMRGGTQTDDLRPEHDLPVVPVVHDVVECDVDRHAYLRS